MAQDELQLARKAYQDALEQTSLSNQIGQTPQWLRQQLALLP